MKFQKTLSAIASSSLAIAAFGLADTNLAAAETLPSVLPEQTEDLDLALKTPESEASETETSEVAFSRASDAIANLNSVGETAEANAEPSEVASDKTLEIAEANAEPSEVASSDRAEAIDISQTLQAPSDAFALESEVQPLVEPPMAQMPDARRFRDVSPTDWAYTALSDLVKRYDCLVGYPDGSFRGNRPLSRYEFAAGLNACLNQIERLIGGNGGVSQEDLESLRKLTQDFQEELAVLKGRVDGLEARVTELENTQFSTTTKLFGQVVVGAQGRSDGTFENLLSKLPDNGHQINVITNVQLSLFTQFSPNSLLLTGLQAGSGNTIGGNGNENYVGLSYEGDTNNSVQISDLTYRHLIANKVAVIVGAAGVNAVNVFRGSNRVESAGFGPLSRFAQRNPIIAVGSGNTGAGFDWQINNNFSLQGVYSTNLANDAANGGLFGGDFGTTSAGLQLVASPNENIDIAFQYINSYSPVGQLGTGVGDNQVVVFGFNPDGILTAPISTNAFGLSAEWRISPKITLGAWGGLTNSNFKDGSGSARTYNWMTYVNFPDLLGEGNLAGLYFGQPPKISSSDLPLGRNIPKTITASLADIAAGQLGAEGGQPDTTYHLEAFYRWRLTDNISLTPGAIVIFNPGHNSNNPTIGIGALRATFTF
ncbi:iron uptake porin [Oscillatoria sp. FACHB-1406]|uniref:iron uptake porin n=1 Tax=Oscillatoria sp. FACHB-1406 TaxID=2692846 RepID=UPI0016875C93|nr:iron uptake porin [Oscillatoria sp. FACHB-1406]MBD2578845.1 carbohydrate porin [Oscillatoria sp. FACHB-1406]